jgi:hypothetical protein
VFSPAPVIPRASTGSLAFSPCLRPFRLLQHSASVPLSPVDPFLARRHAPFLTLPPRSTTPPWAALTPRHSSSTGAHREGKSVDPPAPSPVVTFGYHSITPPLPVYEQEEAAQATPAATVAAVTAVSTALARSPRKIHQQTSTGKPAQLPSHPRPTQTATDPILTDLIAIGSSGQLPLLGVPLTIPKL